MAATAAAYDYDDAAGAGAAQDQAYDPNFVPDSVKSFVVHMYRHIREKNVYEIHQMYETSFQTLSERLFKDSPWPSVDAVAQYVENDHVFCLLYKEMWYRHLYARLSPTLKQRIDSWDNYVNLFQVVLHGVVNMQLPNQWLWDMVDEFVYQFQSFCQYRAKMKNKTEQEITLLRQFDRAWNVFGVLNFLQALVEKSTIIQILEQEKEGLEQFTATDGYDYSGGSNVLKVLGYFSMVGLLRVHCLLGDYQTGLKCVQPIDISQQAWATLPPEILLNVIKRLDESDDSTWPAKKHVEACAAVCKSWRMMMSKGRPEFCGKTTFLVSLKQPACPGETFQCFIKRDKANMTFHLFISLSPPVLPVENGKFLLSAKGTHRGTHTEYIISSDANNISCSGSSYVGKIRSNFIRNKFIIYDSQPQPCTHHIPTTSSSARRFLSKKISPKVPTGSYNIAQVTYKVNLTGVIQPRKMNCIMHSIPASALDVGDRVAGQTPLKPQNVEDSFRNLSLSKSADCPTDYCNKSKPFVLKNKQPRWHEQLQCWCLNFHGRVHVASVKNFQLIDDRDPAADIGAHVYLQFGRVSKDKETFTMDYKYPLSAFQAFAICLSSFSNNLLCDH